MRSLAETLGVRIDSAFAATLATLAASFVVAEEFYKFHSFTLETGAFLATWFVLRRLVKLACGL